MTTLVELAFEAKTQALDAAKAKLNEVRDASKDAANEGDKVAKAFSLMAGPIGLAVTAFLAYAGSVAAAVKSTVEMRAELNNISKSTTASVESLSIMREVAKESGTSFDLVTAALTKFQRSIGDAAKGTGAQAEAFKALGMDVSDGTKPVEEYFDMAAKKLDGFKDGINKNLIAMALFGKTGNELNEFLSDYANRGERAASVTKDQAEEAEKIERALNKVRIAYEEMKSDTANPYISFLSDCIDKYKLAKEPGESFLATMMKIINVDYSTAGSALGELNAQIDVLIKNRARAIAQEKLGGGMDAVYAANDALTKKMAERSALLDKMAQQAGETAKKMMAADKVDAPMIRDSGGSKPKEDSLHLKPYDSPGYDGFKERVREYERNVAQYGHINAQYQRELEQQERAENNLARSYKNLGDPMREYQNNLDDIWKLQSKGKLTADEVTLAIAALDKQFFKVGETMDPVINSMKDLFDGLAEAGQIAASHIEQAFEKLATTGKFSFKGMVSSMLADLSRLMMQKAFTQLLGMAATSFMGSSLGDSYYGVSMGPPRAEGGPINAPSLVGEKGPEIFVPSGAGTIIPNNMLGGSSGQVININTSITVKGGNTNAETGAAVSQAVVQTMKQVARDEIARSQRPGGLSNPMTVRG